jgi:hypothetical protein
MPPQRHGSPCAVKLEVATAAWPYHYVAALSRHALIHPHTNAHAFLQSITQAHTITHSPAYTRSRWGWCAALVPRATDENNSLSDASNTGTRDTETAPIEGAAIRSESTLVTVGTPMVVGSARIEPWDRVAALPMHRGQGASGALRKDGHAQLGLDTARAVSGSPLFVPAVREALTQLEVRQQGEISVSRSLRRNLDQASRVMALATGVSADSATAKPFPEETSMTGRNMTAKWNHASRVQEVRRLRRIAKLGLDRMPDGPSGLKVRAEGVTTVGKACGTCPGSIGLVCASSPRKSAPESSTIFGSADNSTYNSATVRDP